MGYWASKVLPKLKKVFEIKNPKKAAAAAEACKAFDASKDEISKEVEEKKESLQPKVLDIYEVASAEVKTVVKERKESGLKKHTVAVTAFLEELVKIEFPGSKQASEASSQFGPVLVSSSVFFVLEKVAAFVPAEAPKAVEEALCTEVVEVEAAATEKAAEEPSKGEDAAPAPPVAAEEVKAEAVAAPAAEEAPAAAKVEVVEAPKA